MKLWTFLRQCVCLPHFRNGNTFASKVVMKVPGYSRFSGGVGWTEHVEIYRRRFILRTEATWSWRLGRSTVCHPKAQQLGAQFKPEGRRYKTNVIGWRIERKSSFLHHFFHVDLGRLGDAYSHCSSPSEISSRINLENCSTAQSPVALICKIVGISCG